MTKNKFLGLLAGLVILAASATTTKAQLSLNVNIGNWNPPAEYADASYYYLPDVNSYYYVPTHQYIYLNGSNWVWRNTLPARYNYYNINDGYKVAVYRPNPYRYYASDRVRYARYRGVRNVIVRDRYYRPRTVVNRVHYVNRPARVINRGHYVNRPTKFVNRTRIVNRPHGRVVTHTRFVDRGRGKGPGHGGPGHGGGHGHGRGH